MTLNDATRMAAVVTAAHVVIIAAAMWHGAWFVVYSQLVLLAVARMACDYAWQRAEQQ